MTSTHVGVYVAHCLGVQASTLVQPSNCQIGTRPVTLGVHVPHCQHGASNSMDASTGSISLWMSRGSTDSTGLVPMWVSRGHTVSTGPVPMWVSMATLSVQGLYLCGCPGATLSVQVQYLCGCLWQQSVHGQYLCGCSWAHCQCRASTPVGVHGNTVSV